MAFATFGLGLVFLLIFLNGFRKSILLSIILGIFFILLATNLHPSYNDFKEFNPFNIKRSAGIGIRLFMPAFGLLGIDFGHGFDPIPGETRKNGWETHFILGQQL